MTRLRPDYGPRTRTGDTAAGAASGTRRFQRECGTSPLRRGGSITAPTRGLTTRPTRHRRPARVYDKLYSSSDKIIMVREPRKRRRDRGASGKRQRHDPGGAGAARGLIVPSPPRQWHTASDGAGPSATYACVSGRRVHLHSRACSLSGREHSDSALATISHLPVFALAGDRGRSAALQDPCT